MPNAINSATSTDPNAQQTAATGSRALGKNEFLKLLTTQLANQDPLAPTDNQAFIAQLAQFSSVEQAEAMNSRLDALLVAQAAGNQTAIANLVGKDVIFKSSSCELGSGGGPVAISGELSANAAIANAIITDENGRKIRTISLSDVQAGTVNFSWDGKDDSGAAAKPGTYKVELTAADVHGANIGITQRGRGRATSVSFEDGVPQLVVAGHKVKMSDILQIAEGASTSGTLPGTSLSLADLLHSSSGN